MKKCPYCAEEIQDEAIKCKYCRSNLVKPSIDPKSSGVAKSLTKPRYVTVKDAKTFLKYFGIAIFILFGIVFWYLAIPAAIIWYLWKKSKFSTTIKIAASVATVVVIAIIGTMMLYAKRAPSFTITEPKNEASIQAKSVIVKGKVNPKKSAVVINGASVSVSGDGNFSYEVQLPEGKTTVTVQATNSGKAVNATLTINRIFTAEEITEQQRVKAEADAKKQADMEAQEKARAEAEAKYQSELEAMAKAEAEAEANAKAEQAAFDKTKAGRLCKQHPDWTKQECQNVADGKYWIGMTYEMLVASYGSKPDSANPSNYGRGVQWQWCWHDYRPSCFYADEDGIIDSYN